MDINTNMDPETPITADMLAKWRFYLNAFPLPPHLTPTGGAPLKDIDDEVLLNAPPHLIAHIQRTAAQGGYQVVSPRQTPFSSLMLRRDPEVHRLADHEVGSIADEESDWPTLDDDDFSSLLPDEPIAPYTDVVTVRAKTRTASLTKTHELMSDPVLSCLIKGRAVIDILRRDDVAGGPDEMAELLSRAWGVSVEDIMELDAYNLGVEGDLQRHAMRADEVYSVIYAPIHVRSVISMGVSDLDKGLLPPFMAIDWRRLRVFCESVFYNSCVLEGLPLRKMRVRSYPGDPSTGHSRENMMVFGPAPGIAWTFAPETFSIHPVVGRKSERGSVVSIPPEVRAALQQYVEAVRPVSYLLASGKKVDTWRSTAMEVDQVPGETLASSYSQVVRTMMTGHVRGRTATTAVRNAIYEVIESASINTRTRMARYLELAQKECMIHLKTQIVPDSVIHELAHRFSEVGYTVRDRIAKEAERRGSSLQEWWLDILCQAPDYYSEMREGTFGWAKVAIWLMFREPTDRWRRLKGAIKVSALTAAAKNSIGSVPLPPERGSVVRLEACVRLGVKAVSVAFSGYYQGVADVGFAVAKAADSMNMASVANTLREGAYLWILRARAYRGINVSTLAHEEEKKSKNHIRVAAEPVDVVLKPAPYMAYKAWLAGLANSKMIPPATQKLIHEAGKPSRDGEELSRKSSAFSRMTFKILPCPNSTVTQYLNDPRRLGSDMEKAWHMLAGDVDDIVSRFVREIVVNPLVRERIESDDEDDIVQSEANLMARLMEPEPKRLCTGETGPTGKPLRSYWDIYGEAGADYTDSLDEDIYKMPEAYQAVFLEGMFENLEHILQVIENVNGEISQTSRLAGETVA